MLRSMRRASLLLGLLAACAAAPPEMPLLERNVRRALARAVPEARLSLWVCRVDGQ
jgi:hypothetical protein